LTDRTSPFQSYRRPRWQQSAWRRFAYGAGAWQAAIFKAFDFSPPIMQVPVSVEVGDDEARVCIR